MLEYFCCQSSAQQQKGRLPALPLPHAWAFWRVAKVERLTADQQVPGSNLAGSAKQPFRQAKPGKSCAEQEHVFDKSDICEPPPWTARPNCLD